MMDCSVLSPGYMGDLFHWAKQAEIPLRMTFELTPFCNFNCVMCYVRLTPEQAREQGKLMHADQWLEIARQAKEMGTLYLTLTGGEPLTHPEFWTIYQELNKMGFLISVLSNGALIDEAAMEKFRLYGMPYSVKLTLYGASDETYLRTCGSPDGFTRISKAVSLLQEAGVPVSMTSTIVRENACDLQEIYQFARQRGVDLQHTTTVVASSRGAVSNAEQSRFTFDEFMDELTLDVLENNKFPPLESPFAWCNSFCSSIWMAWNGNLQLCSFMSIPAVLFSGDLQTDWRALLQAGKSIKTPPECAVCKWSAFCQRCPGLLCAESGHPEKIDPALCNVAERLYHLYETKIRQEESK